MVRRSGSPGSQKMTRTGCARDRNGIASNHVHILFLTHQALALIAEILVVGLFDRCYEALQRSRSSR
jgi:hypothetical protein